MVARRPVRGPGVVLRLVRLRRGMVRGGAGSTPVLILPVAGLRSLRLTALCTGSARAFLVAVPVSVLALATAGACSPIMVTTLLAVLGFVRDRRLRPGSISVIRVLRVTLLARTCTLSCIVAAGGVRSTLQASRCSTRAVPLSLAFL